MNKLNIFVSKIYNSFFYISAIISIVLFLVSLIISINIKFLIYPSLISDILSLFPNILFIHNYFFPKQFNRTFNSFYLFFLYNLKILIPILISTIFIYFVNNKYSKKFRYIFINSLIFLILSIMYKYFLYKDFESKIFLIYFVFTFLNFVLKNNNFIIKSLLIIPIVNILMLPIHFMEYLWNKVFKIKYKWLFHLISVVLIFMDVIFFIIVFSIQTEINFPKFDYQTNGAYHLCCVNNEIYYSDVNTQKIFECPEDKKNWLNYQIFENIIYKEKNLTRTIMYGIISSRIQDFEINKERNEIYVYNGLDNKLLIIDYETGKIKKEKHLKDDRCDIVSGERICFDNDSKTIALALEHSYFYIFDMVTLDIIKKEDIPKETDDLIFNRIDKSYVMSFWSDKPFFISCPVDYKKEMKIIKCPIAQGEICYSDNNKEIYIPFHQQGEIYVYDANNYNLKRKIKVRYGVKNISYNEEYNLLITASYFSGYVDIISLNSFPNKIIYSKFVNFFIRKPIIFNDILFVPTYYNLHRYNIKNLTSKWKGNN